MNPVTRYGGIFAGIILVAFGIGSTVTGRPGRAGTGRPVGRDWYHPARPQIARCRRWAVRPWQPPPFVHVRAGR